MEAILWIIRWFWLHRTPRLPLWPPTRRHVILYWLRHSLLGALRAPSVTLLSRLHSRDRFFLSLTDYYSLGCALQIKIAHQTLFYWMFDSIPVQKRLLKVARLVLKFLKYFKVHYCYFYECPGLMCSTLIFIILYSTLFHLPLLRLHCVEGCWDRTQDYCDFGIGSQTL